MWKLNVHLCQEKIIEMVNLLNNLCFVKVSFTFARAFHFCFSIFWKTSRLNTKNILFPGYSTGHISFAICRLPSFPSPGRWGVSWTFCFPFAIFVGRSVSLLMANFWFVQNPKTQICHLPQLTPPERLLTFFFFCHLPLGSKG